MGERELITLTIEGIEVSVPRGTTIIEAAKQVGILIPHYCYHPALPIAGVCRMCLVEVEGAPKLQIGCQAQVAEGQVVNVSAPEAAKARQGVLELLLINHPLDCPICDQAGECELQDFVFQEGQPRTRYSPEFPKRFNPVEDFGPDILYVPNRCILCTRCVRFMEDVADTPVLNVSERGDRAFIGIHRDQALDHVWAGNVVDLCPVGSLLSKDSLHKARAWELDKTASVCTGCSQGCNINVDTRNNVVVRLRPRPNAEVNQYFMCDHGRHHYRWLNRGDRIEAPLLSLGNDQKAVDWDHALERAAEILKGAGGNAVALVSPSASTEAMFLARQVLATFDTRLMFRVTSVEGEAPLTGVPNLALREERAPNATGARVLGYEEGDVNAALRGASVALIVNDDLDGVDSEVLAAVGHVIYVGTALPEAARDAAVILPSTNVVEEEGTFVNRDGRVQRYRQAKSAPGMARPAWWILSEILREGEQGDGADTAEGAFAMLAETEEVFQGLSYHSVGFRGRVLANGAGVPS